GAVGAGAVGRHDPAIAAAGFAVRPGAAGAVSERRQGMETRMRVAGITDLVETVGPLMRDFPARWCIAGGWAIDVFLGRVTRCHEDVDLAVFQQDQSLLHEHLRGWSFEKVVNGRRSRWPPDERLALPVHEIHARSPGDPS